MICFCARVSSSTALYQNLSIDIPKIVVVPKGEVVAGYQEFELDTRNINLQPVEQDILIQHLHDLQRYKLREYAKKQYAQAKGA